MANTRELRRRIKSIKNTSQITKAMEMVAVTKMRRSENQAVSGRPYAFTLTDSLNLLSTKIKPEQSKLLQTKSNGKTGIILFTTDKALCGGLNTNVFRSTINFCLDKKELSFYTVGKKGRNLVLRLNKDLVADFENTDQVNFRLAKQLANFVTQSFLNNELKEVYLIFPDFISTLRQEPKVIKLLPISPTSLPQNQKKENSSDEFLFEPNPQELLDFILSHFIEIQIYQALLETKASEHSARMIAMQNATNNAKELVADLTLTYNQTRQDAITRELLEITSALAALE